METSDEAWRFSYADFTEDQYRSLLRDAASHYGFADFGGDPQGPHVLWRHDVDLSMHRALCLARIEASEGVHTTYFIMLTSRYYSVLEPANMRRVEMLVSLGHRIGLHFDCSAYLNLDTFDEMVTRIAWERDLLANLSGAKVRALSFHNPTDFVAPGAGADMIAGMVNAYGTILQARYKYCSDSNGYWRHERLFDVISSRRHERLQVLTHPEWWVPEPMAPRDRVMRCIQGRADATTVAYDAALAASRRENVGS